MLTMCHHFVSTVSQPESDAVRCPDPAYRRALRELDRGEVFFVERLSGQADRMKMDAFVTLHRRLKRTAAASPQHVRRATCGLRE